MDLNQIFESFDKEIFTPETIEKINILIESEVLRRVEESIDEKIKKIEEVFEKEKQEFEEKLIENLDKYLDVVVKDLKEEISSNLTKEISYEDFILIQDLIKSLASILGINLEEIEESKKINKEKISLEKMIDNLNEKNIMLEKENKELKRKILFEETLRNKNLSLIQLEKIKKLVENIPLNSEEEFVNKINMIVETISNTETKTEKIEESFEKDSKIKLKKYF